jgi:putative transposase
VAKNYVWMWDITWLKSPVTGIYYYAYVIEDLFDRSVVSWAIHENESDVHARDLFEAACIQEKTHP